MQRDFKGIWIPREIWLTTELTLQEKVFLVEIDSLDNESGCYASNKHFSEVFLLTTQRCSQVIKSLEKKKIITIEYVNKKDSKEIEKRIIKVSRKFSEGIKYPLGGIKEPLKGYQGTFKGSNTINNTKDNIDDSVEKENILYNEIISYLNEKANKSYNAKTEAHRKLIRARWNEGNRLDQFKRVIDNKVNSWKGVTFNNGSQGDSYLRPKTLFGNQFDEYLNETKLKVNTPAKQEESPKTLENVPEEYRY